MSAIKTHEVREYVHLGMHTQHGSPARVNLPAFDAWLAGHDAEVEAKVRAQIAADIEVLRADAALPSPVSYRAARDDAARIAKGGA